MDRENLHRIDCVAGFHSVDLSRAPGEPLSDVSEDRNEDYCCSSDHGGHDHDGGEELDIKGQLSIVGLAAVLFVIGLFYRSALHDTPFSFGEYLAFISSYLIAGWGVLSAAGRNILRGKFFDENFLMSVATLGAIAIHELPEAVGVMLFFRVERIYSSTCSSPFVKRVSM